MNLTTTPIVIFSLGYAVAIGFGQRMKRAPLSDRRADRHAQYAVWFMWGCILIGDLIVAFR